LEEQYSANIEERIKTFQKEASNEPIDESKVKYANFGNLNKSAIADNSVEGFSVNRLISKFENNLSAAPPGFDDHAIVDEVDVRKLSVILGHEPENKELADIQDNKTDDDQPDLETDESSGEKSKIKLDVSMEGFTEATDITTPVEMAQESVPSKRDDFDTSYQISDIPAEFSKYDNKITSPATLHRETLFEITDLEDLTDIEETKEDIFVQQSSRSDQTLVADTSPKVVDTKIKRREKNIDRKFERLSMDLSDTEMNVEKEMFVKVSTQISKEEEEQAARSFDKIMFDNFAEDKSEDWLTHGSEPTPEKEVATDIFGEPDHEALEDKLPKKDMVTNLTETGSNEPRVDLDKAISREQSFVYDTSVEAFGSKGEVIDGHCGNNKIIEEECLTGGISLIGQIAEVQESTNDKDEIRDFIESNTPSKESQVEKFEYVENKNFDINEDNISTSPEERPESDKSDIVIEELNENFKIPLSSSPLKVDTLFLTESTESQSETSETKAEGIEIPRPDRQNRRLSNISVEEENKISSTPEGESYFMKREQSFISKVEKGQMEQLAVEISDYYSLDEASNDKLCVKPIESTPETEIEIRDLPSASNLTVKPVETLARRIPVSSYEQIYDTVSIEDIAGHSRMSAAEIMSSLGDRFQGTHEVPEFVSSFEDLYQRSAEGMADDITLSALKATAELPGERWSAPAGAIEPPILEANEFSSRIAPLQNKIENHWDQIEILMSTETLVGQDQESSKKPSSTT